MGKQSSIWIKRTIRGILLLFVLMNILAIFHAYHFTHFSEPGQQKTGRAEQLTFSQAVKALVLGVNMPRPENKSIPTGKFETVILESEPKIHGWSIPTLNIKPSKGTILLCHGYGGEKSQLLDRSNIFNQLEYNTFLIDFMGSGGSEGSTTTIGFKEAKQVKAAYEYLVQQRVQDIYLYGNSMGAVAIMKAIHEFDLQPKGIILECPFGSMYQTVAARFSNMNIPAFPMAGLLVFWGGIQNGFWAFEHNPIDYAPSIRCPTLLLYGAKDKNVSRQEIDQIFSNLGGPKRLGIYPEAGHENYLLLYREAWTADLTNFLSFASMH